MEIHFVGTASLAANADVENSPAALNGQAHGQSNLLGARRFRSARLSPAAHIENLSYYRLGTYRHPKATPTSRVGTVRPRKIGVGVGCDF